MPITEIFFAPRGTREIHLVRGQSGQSTGDLRESLVVIATDDTRARFSNYAATHNDVRIHFSPNFNAQTDTPTEFQGFGIRVNKTTGEISVASGPAPNPSPANFIVEAAVTQNTGGPQVASAFIRVHVHTRVERIWLTPPRLSVRAKPGTSSDALNYPFTARAEFDDGTVADVTRSEQLTFAPSSCMVGPDVRVPSSAAPGDVLPVTVKSSAKWNSRSADAEIAVLHPWDTEPNPPQADLVEGKPGVWEGVIRPEAVPNILFLGCGFTSPEIQVFEQIANLIVQKLKTVTMLRPFDLLATSMNFWRVTVPSATPGISVRSEVWLQVRDGVLVAKQVPAPVVPPANMADWTVEHLIFAVGLPVLADLALISETATGQPVTSIENLRLLPDGYDFGALFQKWRATARPHPGHDYGDVPLVVALEWIKLADRLFIDDVDHYPPMSLGSPPDTMQTQSDRFSEFAYRGSEQEKTAFFRAITATPRGGGAPIALDGVEPDNALGNLWIVDPASREAFQFDNRAYVTYYSNIPFGQIDAGIHMRLERLFIKPTGERVTILGIPVTRVAGRRSVAYAPSPLTVDSIDSSTWHTFAHELAHTLHLGDEYIGTRGEFKEPEEKLALWANLTTTAAVLDNSGKVRVDQIKWNWHRIRKASVLTAPVEPQPDPQVNRLFHVLLGPGRGFQFTARDGATGRPGDKVRLRTRKKHTVVARPPVAVASTVEFEVLEVREAPDRRSMTLVLKADDVVDVSQFGIGSLVYIPVPAPDAIRTVDRPYLTLVPPAAERIMAATGGTLEGGTCTPDLIPFGVPGKQDPTGKTPDNILTHLVGVYFGGDRFTCGILHPVGGCLMRTSISSPEGVPEGVTAFCPVCRYALVDYVDPEQHWANDRDYDKWFPF